MHYFQSLDFPDIVSSTLRATRASQLGSIISSHSLCFTKPGSALFSDVTPPTRFVPPATTPGTQRVPVPLPILALLITPRLVYSFIHTPFVQQPSMTSQTALHRTISFEANARFAPPISSYNPAMSTTKSGRRRRSSSIIYQEPPESLEQISDQSSLPNLNSQWVNSKGAS